MCISNPPGLLTAQKWQIWGGGLLKNKLDQLDISCWEETNVTVTLSLPPALVNHLYVGDDVIRDEGDLIISFCWGGDTKRFVHRNADINK